MLPENGASAPFVWGRSAQLHRVAMASVDEVRLGIQECAGVTNGRVLLAHKSEMICRNVLRGIDAG